MKISNNQVDSFIANGAKAVEAALVYGPDVGLVRERAKTLAKNIVSDLNDPFNVSTLSGSTILEDPAMLSDHLNALSMTSDKRLVLVSDASDRIADIVESSLSLGNLAAFLILKAGDLKPRSKLRSLAETSNSIAALACYSDDNQSIARLIDDIFSFDKIGCDLEARSYLEQNLGNDRGISRSELKKLAIFAGPNGQLGLEDIATLIGDNTTITLSDIAFSATDGSAAETDRYLSRCVSEDIPSIAILRAVSNHLLRLQLTVKKIANGEPQNQAVNALRPPVFFKTRDRFIRQLNRWRDRQISKGLSLLIIAEQECKKAGSPDLAICGRTLHQIAALARQGCRR